MSGMRSAYQWSTLRIVALVRRSFFLVPDTLAELIYAPRNQRGRQRGDEGRGEVAIQALSMAAQATQNVPDLGAISSEYSRYEAVLAQRPF